MRRPRERSVLELLLDGDPANLRVLLPQPSGYLIGHVLHAMGRCREGSLKSLTGILGLRRHVVSRPLAIRLAGEARRRSGSDQSKSAEESR